MSCFEIGCTCVCCALRFISFRSTQSLGHLYVLAACPYNNRGTTNRFVIDVHRHPLLPQPPFFILIRKFCLSVWFFIPCSLLHSFRLAGNEGECSIMEVRFSSFTLYFSYFIFLFSFLCFVTIFLRVPQKLSLRLLKALQMHSERFLLGFC